MLTAQNVQNDHCSGFCQSGSHMPFRVTKQNRAYKSISHLKSEKNIQTVFIPNAYGKNPIAQAYLTRGGFPSIQFYINQRKVDEESMENK